MPFSWSPEEDLLMQQEAERRQRLAAEQQIWPANNPIGTETTHTVSPRTWWDDTKDALWRGVKDPSSIAQMVVGANPAANIVLSGKDIAEGGTSMVRHLLKGDTEGSREGSLQLGIGLGSTLPILGPIVRKAGPEIREGVAALRAGTRAAERDVAPTASRVVAEAPVPPPSGLMTEPRVEAPVPPSGGLMAQPRLDAPVAAPDAPVAPREPVPGVPVPEPPPDPGIQIASAGMGEGTRGMSGLPSLRNFTQDEAIAHANTDVHLIPKPGGKEGYVGFPEWVKTPDDVAKMRGDFDRRLELGKEYRDWYDRTRDWNREITGGDVNRGRMWAGTLGATSPKAAVPSNLKFALQGDLALQRDATKPLPIVYTGQIADSVAKLRQEQIAAIARGEEANTFRGGLKTDPFSSQIDFSRPESVTPTNDTWQARGWGYQGKEGKPFSGTIGPQMHQVLDRETLQAVDRANKGQIGGHTDWTSARAQAAVWVGAKIESEMAKGKTFEEAAASMGKAFQDFAEPSTAYVAHEQAPGGDTNIRQVGTPQEWRARSDWRSPSGNDAALVQTGILSPNTVTAPGAWKDAGTGVTEYNPVDVARGLLDFEAGTRVVPPGTKATMTADSAARGLIDFQQGQGWHLLDPGADPKLANSVQIRLGRVPTQDEVVKLSGLADREGFIFSNTADGGTFLHDPEHKTAGSRGGADVGKMLRGQLGQDIEAAVPGAKVVRGRAFNDFVSYADEIAQANQGKGDATRILVGKLNAMRETAPDMLDRMLDNPAHAAKAQANLDRLRETGQLGQRPDYEELLRLIAEGRLRGLVARTQSPAGFQGLPAVAGLLGLGGAAAGAGGSSQSER